MSTPGNQTVPPPGAIWSSGDYEDVADRMIPQLGARLVELAGVSREELILDVAAGAGNATLPAAHTGARVTALDITQVLLDAGAKRASAAGLEIEWVYGDAQAMPFADAGFDRVLSCVGVQFCADPRAAAAELLRVCRPGGTIALIAWTPEGFIGQVLQAIAKATGTTRSPFSPLSWGSETGLSELFGAERIARATVQRDHAEMTASSPAGWVDYMAQAYGPMVRARSTLEAQGTWKPLREQLAAIAATHHTREDERFAVRAEYLAVALER